MATTWEVISQRFVWFLEEAVIISTASWLEGTRIDAWNMAQHIFASHTALQKKETVAVATGATYVQLPDDFFEIASLYDSTNLKLAGQPTFKVGYDFTNPARTEYWIWNNNLYLNAPAMPTSVDLYYYAFWPDVIYKVETDGAVTIYEGDVLVPSWSITALLHLTTAILLQPKSVQSAMNREYNIKIDSGTPDDNARRSQAREHLWWYRELLKEHPVQTRKGIGQ